MGDVVRDGGGDGGRECWAWIWEMGRLLDDTLEGRAVNHGCARICGIVRRFVGSFTIMFWIKSRASEEIVSYAPQSIFEYQSYPKTAILDPRNPLE